MPRPRWCGYFSGHDRLSRQQLEDGLRRTMQDPRIFENFRWRYGYPGGMGVHIPERNRHRCSGSQGDKARCLPSIGREGWPRDVRINYLGRGMHLIYHHYLKEGGVRPPGG